MITQVLNKLVKLIVQSTSIADNIEIANISMINDGDEFLETSKSILVSVINMEEDKVLKNQSIYNYERVKVISGDGEKDIRKVTSQFNHPAQHLIVSVLFCAYQKNNSSINYLNGLENLEKIIAFFQANNSFYQHATNVNDDMLTYAGFAADNNIDPADYIKVTSEFVSLNNDQQNHMWSFLGSKYMPSVLYKLRLIAIQEPVAKAPVSDIKEVEVNLWKQNKNDAAGLLSETTFVKTIVDGKEIIERKN